MVAEQLTWRCTYCNNQGVAEIEVPVMRSGRRGVMRHTVCPTHLDRKQGHYKVIPIRPRRRGC